MPEEMTYNQMIAFINTNPYKKVTHWLFGEDEYIYANRGGVVFTEEGYVFENWKATDHCHNGLRMRTDINWQTGWKLWEQK
jgi:hypothetical protein